MGVSSTIAWVHFTAPGYLVLFALVPLLLVFSIRSLAGLGPIRRWLAIVLRCAVIACMILALAGAERVEETDAVSVIFVVDRSRSVPRPQQQEAFEFVKAAQEGLRPQKNDQIGVIGFDGRAAVEQPLWKRLGIANLSEAIDPDQTDIAAALRMGMALFTDVAARRLVVLSDGNENVGDVLIEADQYSAAGVPIDVLPIRYQHGEEVVFERLSAPATARAEETINLQMIVRAQRETSGRIRLYHNDHLIDLDATGGRAGFPVELDAGSNRLTLPVPLRVAGAHRFRAVFEPDNSADDTIPGNNEGQAFTVVSGQGRILILATDDGGGESGTNLQSAQIFADALRREQLVCEVELVGSEPLDQVRLLEYSAVILSNVSADAFTPEQRQALAVYVRDLGGGLIMLGGDESFGAGGWMNTPVEEVMPVSFDVKSKRQIPKGALVLVMHACEIPEGNYWGERVAIAAVKTLSSRDLIGVLSYRWQGADQQYWDVPLQPVGDKGRIINRVKQMNMGDMPDLDAVMRPGVDALAALDQSVAAKHMIIVSDFDPSPPRADLIKKMKENGITCSTVAIGYGGHEIYEGNARQIADATGGKFYTTQDYRQLPQIFIKESRVVRRSLINENPFRPQLLSTLPTTVSGLSGEELPTLGGLVITTKKPLAEMPLGRPSEDGEIDPVLAQWQVGLGKAVAFTSGMWPRWGAEWAQWPKFSKVWAQIVRWVSRQSAASAFDVSTSVQGGRGRIRIDALDKNAAAINFMNIEGTLVRPDQESEGLRLTQTGPGVYEGEFDARGAGSYVMNFAYRMGRGSEEVSGTLQTGLSVAFSPEYRELETNAGLLKALTDRTGGRLLTTAEAASVFDPGSLTRASTRSAIWEDLVRLMLLLFLLDVAVRRIAIDPLEVARKIRRRIAEMAGRRQPAEASAAVLSTLKGARDRVRDDREQQRRPTDAGPAPDRSAKYEPTLPDSKVTEQLTKALDGASEMDAPVVARPTKKKPPASQTDFTSRLLKAKRKAKDDMERQRGNEGQD